MPFKGQNAVQDNIKITFDRKLVYRQKAFWRKILQRLCFVYQYVIKLLHKEVRAKHIIHYCSVCSRN